MDNFDPYDFENMLQENFFCGNDLDEIKYAIKSRLKSDSVFAEQFEEWISESTYNSWIEFYNEMKSQEEAAWDMMYPNREEND